MPSEISPAMLGTKLGAVTIPVINENVNYCDDFGFSASGTLSSGQSLALATNQHFITSPFAEGGLTIFSSAQSTVALASPRSSDLHVLGRWGSAAGLAVLEAGARRHDSGTITARRVQLPWGGAGFDVDALNSDGQLLLKRAILWAGGLVAYYPLDATSGVIATDGSGYENDGLLNNGLDFASDAQSPAKLNGGLQFDGYDDYISVSNAESLQLSEALSISAWINGDTWGAGSYANAILRKGEDNPNNYHLAISDGKLTLYLDDSNTGGVRGNTLLSTGQWYHVVAVWDGATAKLYVNGVLDNEPGTPRAGTLGVDTRPLYVGGQPSATDGFDGVLDDVRLFNYALELDEVKNLHGLGQPRGVRIIKWVEIK